MEAEQRLMVYMLGGFEVYYGGMPLQFHKKLTAKPLQLLQLLLYHRREGVSREGVLEALYGQRAEIDSANNLNATVSQLRKLLRETHLPEGNYIHMQANRYFFAAPFDTWVDVEAAQELRREADLSTGEARYELLHELCDLYRGRFLPGLDGESWVEVAKAEYQRVYRDSLTELCHMLEERQAYDEILRLTELAAALFPFDEWQVWEQEALLKQGRFRQAQELYLQVEKLYRDALDSPPPEIMRRRLQKPEKKFWRRTESAENVRRWLTEENVTESNCVPLAAFSCVYNLVNRMSGADNPYCLLICAIRQADARYTADAVRLGELMEKLSATLTRALRREDVFTRYSREQYLVLLTGTREENLPLITDRIQTAFRESLADTGFALEFQTVPVDDLPEGLAGK